MHVLPRVLRNPASHRCWEDDFDGVEYVTHVASLVGIVFDNPATEVIEPAVLGTRVSSRVHMVYCCVEVSIIHYRLYWSTARALP